MTEDQEEYIQLGTSDYQEAKRVQARLEEIGVQLQLAGNPEHCGKGCKPVVEILARAEDLPRIREFFENEKNRTFDGLQIDPELLNEVYDPERETARCPACGTVFSTKAAECPDCGLVFAS